MEGRAGQRSTHSPSSCLIDSSPFRPVRASGGGARLGRIDRLARQPFAGSIESATGDRAGRIRC